MKIIDCVQGTPAWERARLGIPTASAFHRIITPTTLKPSKEAVEYRNQLLTEYLLDTPVQWGGWSGERNNWMERGTEMEAEARAFYEFQFDREITQVGLILRDDERSGGSPDGLVEEDGMVEFKCPALHTHVGYLLNPTTLETKYRGQTQGLLYVSERQWVDLISYNPELPPVAIRVPRDEKFIAALDAALEQFNADLDDAKRILKAKMEAHAGPEYANV